MQAETLPSRLAALALVALFAIQSISPAQAQTPDVPNIAAASDLKFALDEIAAKFAEETGMTVQPTYGSSGNFFRQIAQGAPFQMFLSADEAFIQRLHEQGRTVDGGQLYAVGRIVLFAPMGSPIEVDGMLSDLKAAVEDGRLTRFAIANPEHAPYGRAAEEALRSQGLWEAILNKLVLGENVSQAAQFATTGSAQGGIFAYSLALSPAVNSLGDYVLLPEEWHGPLRQRMALIKDAGETARAFHAYVQEPEARAIFRRYGFALPDEGS
jgi:molybdate transport system substrate-binding protein